MRKGGALTKVVRSAEAAHLYEPADGIRMSGLVGIARHCLVASRTRRPAKARLRRPIEPCCSTNSCSRAHLFSQIMMQNRITAIFTECNLPIDRVVCVAHVNSFDVLEQLHSMLVDGLPRRFTAA